MANAFIPKITSGITIRVDTAYPIHNGMPSPSWSPWAMIEPSSAKKMKVNVAEVTFVRTDP
ncbi:MAG TPA: hypothetical protein VFC16_10960 [Nakamurella sp.]|nr:hypothetical protein [Nakamurella sp.]